MIDSSWLIIPIRKIYTKMNRILVADLALLLLNVLWGYCYIIIKQLLLEISPFYMLSLRFLIASIAFLPFQFPDLLKISYREALYYFSCGLVLSTGFIFQTLGMTSTNPGKSGVITGSLVVFVPVIHYFWTGIRFRKSIFFGTLLTFIGLCFVSLDGVSNFSEIKIGDIYLLLGAVAYALHIVVVDRTYSALPVINPLLLALIQLFVVGLFSLILALSQEIFPTSVSETAILGILFISIFGSLLAYIVQMWAQKHSPPAHVGVILSTEAVFACVFSYFIFGENFTFPMWIGGLLILLGILVTEGILSYRISRALLQKLGK